MARLMEGEKAFIANEKRNNRTRSCACLSAIPEAGNNCANECRYIRTPHTERRPWENRIRHARSYTGITDHVHQNENHDRAQADRNDEIDEATANQKETCSELIAPEAADV